MRVEMKIGEALDEAFRAAFVLTGSIEAAERAVADGITTLGFHLAGDTLLIETARFAIQRRAEFSDEPEALSILPLELQGLFLISTICRDCFVLRMLVGLTAEVSAGILNLSKEEIDEALYCALLDLPRSIDSIRSIEDECRRSVAARPQGILLSVQNNAQIRGEQD
jgi:hypothetical protein